MVAGDTRGPKRGHNFYNSSVVPPLHVFFPRDIIHDALGKELVGMHIAKPNVMDALIRVPNRELAIRRF